MVWLFTEKKFFVHGILYRELFVTVLAWFLSASCGSPAYGEVAVFVGQSSRHPSSASIELYQAVMEVLGEARGEFVHWSPIPSVTVAKYLTALPGSQTDLTSGYGAVPVFDVDSLRQHMQAQHNRQNHDSEMAELQEHQSQMELPPIIAVQKTLEAMAVTTALLVDCQHSKEDILESCSLFLYDRRQARVIAAVEKKFTHGVVSARQWASYLVETLSQGLRSVEQDRDRRLLDKVLNGGDGSLNQSQKSLKLRIRIAVAGGMRLLNSNGVSFFPEGNVKFLRNLEGVSYGVVMSGTQFGRRVNGKSRDYQFYRGGFSLGLHRQTHKFIEWSLYSSVYYGVRQAKETPRHPTGPAKQLGQKTKDISIEFTPEVQWQLHRSVALGIALPVSRFFKLREEHRQVDILPISDSIWAIALVTTATF